MSYLTRRPGEAVIIDDRIGVQVVEARGRTVMLGCSCLPDARLLRAEIHEQLRQENLRIVRAAAALAGKGHNGAAGLVDGAAPGGPCR